MKFITIVLLLSSFVNAQEEKNPTEKKPDRVVILTAKGSIFDQARNGLLNEIHDEFSFSVQEITDKTSIEELDTLFNVSNQPNAVILIGNNAIRIYAKYCNRFKEKTALLQTIAILALDVTRAVSGITNVTCIAYETPMVTALVSFRRVIDKPLNKVGVIYRKPLKEFVEKHTYFCSKEKIEIKGIEIGNDPSKHHNQINNALKVLIKKEKIDALFITNDNVLLTPELLVNTWFPGVKNKKIPIIVGVEALVNPDLNFGTFAVIPDPTALGEQAAGILYDLQTDDWEFNGITILHAISMYSVLNLKKVSEILDQEKLKTSEVSKVLNGNE